VRDGVRKCSVAICFVIEEFSHAMPCRITEDHHHHRVITKRTPPINQATPPKQLDVEINGREIQHEQSEVIALINQRPLAGEGVMMRDAEHVSHSLASSPWSLENAVRPCIDTVSENSWCSRHQLSRHDKLAALLGQKRHFLQPPRAIGRTQHVHGISWEPSRKRK